MTFGKFALIFLNLVSDPKILGNRLSVTKKTASPIIEEQTTYTGTMCEFVSGNPNNSHECHFSFSADGFIFKLYGYSRTTRQATSALKILKTSGKHLARQAQKNLLLVILCIATTSIFLLISFPKLPTRIDLGDYEMPFVLATVFPMAGIWYYWKKYHDIKMGIEGENMVTQVLESKLNDDYYLVNDVLYINDRGNKENIDHIVLGPKGVFAIETKHYRGKVTCKGSFWQVPFPFGRSPSSQAKGNASWVNKAIKASGVFETLKVWVEPIVVFSNPDVELETIDTEVEVVTLDKLVNSITSYDNGYSFSPEQLKLVGEGILKQVSHATKESE